MRTVCLNALIAGVLLGMGTTTAQDAKEAPSKPVVFQPEWHTA